jgi:hypothetical protein
MRYSPHFLRTLALAWLLGLTTLPLLAAPALHNTNKAWFRGTWAGDGYQLDTRESWAMQVHSAGRRYVVSYPSLGCKGHWTLIWSAPRRLIFREHITEGAHCLNGGTVRIDRLNPHQVVFLHFAPGATQALASALLSRRPQHTE